MFDATAHKLARLVQIPRYVKYLWGGNTQRVKYHDITLGAKAPAALECVWAESESSSCLYFIFLKILLISRVPSPPGSGALTINQA